MLFRVGCLAYFCANLSNWAAVIILFTMMVNMLILHYGKLFAYQNQLHDLEFIPISQIL